MKRRKPLKPGKSPVRKKRPRSANPKRRPAKFTRTYGSVARVIFVRRLPCVCCGRTPSENSHIRSRSGAGRKGDYTTIVPMCVPHHVLYDDAGAFRAAYPDLDLETAAADTERAWQAECARLDGIAF